MDRVLKISVVSNCDLPFGWVFFAPGDVEFAGAVHVDLVVAGEDEADAVVEEEVALFVVADEVGESVSDGALPRHGGFGGPVASPQHHEGGESPGTGSSLLEVFVEAFPAGVVVPL